MGIFKICHFVGKAGHTSADKSKSCDQDHGQTTTRWGPAQNKVLAVFHYRVTTNSGIICDLKIRNSDLAFFRIN